jgi:HD-like signal output (HDOD) protein/DNA-binding NarL/FixJ family response regulator
MKPVLIASSTPAEARELKETISQEYNVSVITSPTIVDQRLKKYGLVLFDHGFTEYYGEDFLMGVLRKSYLPVLMLTPPDDVKGAIEAMRVGTCNYIVKVGDYHKVLNLSIKQAIEKFDEQDQVKQTIITLNKRVNELEERLGAAGKEDVQTSPPGTSTNILDQIIFIFKRGEINLPALPQITIKFKEMVNKGAGLQEIAFLLQQDAAISAKLISICNSAYYGGMVEYKTLGQAVARLGLTATRQYVDAISNRALYVTKNKKFSEFIGKLWEHSLSCAYASQIVCEALKLQLPDDPFTLGLMHDIGKLVLFQAVGELQIRKKLGEKFDSEEVQNTVDTHHGKFGAALLKRWNFSSGYVQIATYHDNLEEAAPISKELLVVHFANLLVKSMGYDQTQQAEVDVEEAESTRLLRLDSTMIAHVKDQVKVRMETSTDIL